jgi:hypothetical protein
VTAYELLFILLFLASAAAVVIGVILWITKERRTATRILLSLAAVWGIYLVALGTSDALARQRVTRAGDDLCFDEMCFAVVGVQTQTQPSSSGLPAKPRSTLYVITVRVTSRSLGRPQAEGGLRARLYKDARFFNISERSQQAYDAQHGATPKLTQKLDPGESILSVLVFDLPSDITTPALTLDHGFTPGYFIIGESPFFHKPDILQLSPAG